VQRSLPTGNECLNLVTGFPAPLRTLCRLSSRNRQMRHPNCATTMTEFMAVIQPGAPD
jgi:hypothetical protein